MSILLVISTPGVSYAETSRMHQRKGLSREQEERWSLNYHHQLCLSSKVCTSEGGCVWLLLLTEPRQRAVCVRSIWRDPVKEKPSGLEEDKTDASLLAPKPTRTETHWPAVTVQKSWTTQHLTAPLLLVWFIPGAHKKGILSPVMGKGLCLDNINFAV